MFSGEFISVVVEFVSVGWEVVLFCEVLLFRLEEILSVVVVFSESRGVLFVEVLMFRLKEVSFFRRFHGVCELFCTTTDNDK